MKVQLQTNFMANYGLRRSIAQPTGISRVNFGTNPLEALSEADAALFKQESKQRIDAEARIAAERNTQISSRVDNILKRLDENRVLSGLPQVTSEQLLTDILQSLGDRNCTTVGEYADKRKLKSTPVLASIRGFMEQLASRGGDIKLGEEIFDKHCYTNIPDTFSLTDIGKAVKNRLLAKAAQAVKV